MEVVTRVPEQTVYVPFLVTERAVVVYIETNVIPDVTEERIVDDIRTRLYRSGIGLAEPLEYGLLDQVPNSSRSITGTVEDIIYKINRGEI